MGRDDVVFRGTRQGLSILIGDESPFAVVLDKLREKLSVSDQFFAGAAVKVNVGRRDLSPDERQQLEEVLRVPHGLSLADVVQGELSERKAQARGHVGAARGSQGGEGPPLVVHRTLRSGNSLRHHGDVIVLGDVNAGAEVIASGHVIVMGALRGVVHAGAPRDNSAVVVAGRLQPTQLRIGTTLSRGDDQHPSGPGVARVQDGIIVIDEGPAPPGG